MAIMNSTIEKKLWDAADSLRTNSKLKSSEYATPVLGLIFLRFADYRFTLAKGKIDKEFENSRRKPSQIDYQKIGVLYVPETARYSYLLNLPESEDIQQAVIQAMKDIEIENISLKDVLPKQYKRVPKDILISLLKTFSEIEMEEHNGDTFGAIYEYFLGKFASSEGQKGGEFFTPTSLVRLIVEILEPDKGFILDPACGSGGMFVQSAKFVNRHSGNPNNDISIFGQENIADTVRLCKMNLAVHGLEGDVKEFNTYYQNVHGCYNKMNYIMANPPFNAKGVDKERVKGDKRYPFGIPSNDNANILNDMLTKNKTRTDYLERFEKMISEYNSGSKNVDLIYRDLVDFAESLSDEQKRHLQENISEEELALFDILIKPEMELSVKEKLQVKKVARSLLKTLKHEKLILDWRKKQQARADVLYTIETVLDNELPRSYSTEVYRKKCEMVYQHVYDNYYGNGQSLYSMAS